MTHEEKISEFWNHKIHPITGFNSHDQRREASEDYLRALPRLKYQSDKNVR